MAALAAAGRRVARLFPEMPLSAALARWAEDVLAATSPKPLPPSAFRDVAEHRSADGAGDQWRMQLRGVRLGPWH